MQIAAVCALRCVEIAVSIQPKNEKRAVLVLRMGSHSRDGAHGKRMIATHKDRQTYGRRFLRNPGEALCPANAFGQRKKMRILFGCNRVWRNISLIAD